VKRRFATGFLPSLHGFRFPNRFDLKLGTIGLCGGMAFLAADHFLAGSPIPPDTDPPARGSALFIRLRDRQLDSLGITGLTPGLGRVGLEFLEWMALPTNGPQSTARRTAREIEFIAADLTQQRLVVLGLVLLQSNNPIDVTENHQVLAYALNVQAQDRFSLRVYDPNFPLRDDITIAVTLRKTPHGLEASAQELVPKRKKGPIPIRGFFKIPYFAKPVSP
jgi:hypothetical protein